MTSHAPESEERDLVADRIIFERELPAINQLIRQYKKRFGVPPADEDVSQECMIEAWRAIATYDPARGGFSSYISRRIMGCAARASVARSRLSARDRDQRIERIVRQTGEEIRRITGWEPRPQDIAHRTGLSLEEVSAVLAHRVTSLHSSHGSAGERALEETVADPHAIELPSLDEGDPRAELAARVDRCLAALADPLQQGLFKLRYARLLMDEGPLTLEHAARVLHIAHPDDAWMLEHAALGHLENLGLIGRPS